MKMFDVIVTRNTTESVCILVEAADEEAAVDYALTSEATQYRDFEVDSENEPDDHYITGCDEVDQS
jgi:hypothetical protein